jgi:Zn-dependent peptidase ImmA (M78 family)
MFDRLAIEEDGPNPERLAQAVHKQLGTSNKAVPIVEIATALDITEIRYEPLESFEGALLTTPERDVGSILVNESSGSERRRFTIAHELGHYLNVWHTPTSEAGFMCAKSDLGSFIIKPGLTVHELQELQANQFAIELLAPRKQVERLTSDEPSLAEALAMGDRFELSKAASTRRYAELHHCPVAIVYTQQGKINFHIPSKSCPTLQLRKNDTLISRIQSVGTRSGNMNLMLRCDVGPILQQRSMSQRTPCSSKKALLSHFSHLSRMKMKMKMKIEPKVVAAQHRQ